MGKTTDFLSNGWGPPWRLRLTSSTKWVGLNPTQVPPLKTAYCFAATSLLGPIFLQLPSPTSKVAYVFKISN